MRRMSLRRLNGRTHNSTQLCGIVGFGVISIVGTVHKRKVLRRCDLHSYVFRYKGVRACTDAAIWVSLWNKNYVRSLRFAVGI